MITTTPGLRDEDEVDAPTLPAAPRDKKKNPTTRQPNNNLIIQTEHTATHVRTRRNDDQGRKEGRRGKIGEKGTGRMRDALTPTR